MQAFLVLCVWFGANGPAQAATPGEVPVGGKLRDVPMQGLSGPSALLSDFRGKPLVINVWASWCGPCRDEMASLDRLARHHGGKQFAVIGISTDDYPQNALAFLRRAGVGFRQFIDTRLVLENMLGADHIPLTLLVDAQGTVLLKVSGGRQWDSADALATIARTFGIPLRALGASAQP